MKKWNYYVLNIILTIDVIIFILMIGLYIIKNAFK